jgi:hypothetical protein
VLRPALLDCPTLLSPLLCSPLLTSEELAWPSLDWPALAWPKLCCPLLESDQLTCPALAAPLLCSPLLTIEELAWPSLCAPALELLWLRRAWIDGERAAGPCDSSPPIGVAENRLLNDGFERLAWPAVEGLPEARHQCHNHGDHADPADRRRAMLARADAANRFLHH